MQRRQFIGNAGLAGILATGMAPAVQANQALRWRLASSFPKTLDITHGSAHVFARAVKDMSGGKIDISVHAADELMPALGVFDGVKRGVVECGHTAPYDHIGKDETFALDCAIPFGLNARQMTAWMLYGNGLELLREFYKGFGIVNFPLGNSGAQMGGWYRQPVRKPADLKGLRMRMTGLGAQVFERLGGTPIILPGSDLYQALERGTLAAAAGTGPHDDRQRGLHQVAPYYGYPGWWAGGTQLALYVNQRAYDALTAESKAIIEAAAAVAHRDMQAHYDTKNALALKALVAGGTHLTALPKSLLDRAYQAAQELYVELSGKNPHWKRIYASYAAFLKEQSWAWGHAELSFDHYMYQQTLAQLKKQAKPAKLQKSAPAGRH